MPYEHEEFDKKARELFVAGDNAELLGFLVDGLGKLYDGLNGPEELRKEVSEVIDFANDFFNELDEKLSNFTMEEGRAIVMAFVTKARSEFFSQATPEDIAAARQGQGPWPKWVYIYQQIVQILAPAPCQGGGCGGGCGGCQGGCGHQE